MYKLKNSYIDRMIENKTTRYELAFLLYIARSQDSKGRVHSVYYKDVCSAISCSIQKFYDILQSLQDKGLISCEKYYNADIFVQLIGNDFSDENFEEGYVNVAKKEFNNEKFTGMLAGSQLLFLYSQRFVQGKHMFVSNFYDEFCKTFHVVRKTMQIYLQELKDRKLLFVSKKRNKAYNYEIMMKRSPCLDIDDFHTPREKQLYVDNIKKLITNNFQKYLSEDKDIENTLNDIAGLVEQKRENKYPNFVFLIVTAVKRSLSKQRAEKRKEIRLNAPLINKCLNDVIDDYLSGNIAMI